MSRKLLATSVETLASVHAVNDELRTEVAQLQAQLTEREQQIAALQNQLSQYWDLQDGVDYRSLVEQIRDDAQLVAQKLRSLDRHSVRQLAGISADASSAQPPKVDTRDGLVGDVLSLLRSINRWK